MVLRSSPSETFAPAGAARPEVILIDGLERGLDQAGLRAAAREAGGARSYRWPFAVVACWPGQVGVDIERIDRGVPDRVFAGSICTPEERAALGPRRFEPEVLASLWCGKEALAKALGDAVAYDPRRLGAPLLWPEGRCGRWRAEQLRLVDGHIVWLCWSPAIYPSG